ncbi:LysO family transporter [uncultured Methanobrevibacter sp.]|uniref:LysO family transporter n=1 Tax=uncultured Methanobrevibacter sp. TaxID=253161 RepID=UPI0026E06B96|nr:LysO family transporter [uncultured Methanobrevibacter sp.]
MDLIDESESVSVHGITNWVLLLLIFSIIVVIGNYVGYKHPISESLVGMLILSFITLIGMLLERYVPLNISSIVYISLIGLVLSLPFMPTSGFIVYYVSKIELLAIVTVFLAYVGIGMGKNWDQFKKMGWRGAIVTVFVITGTYLGSAIIAHVVLILTGT